MNSPESPPNVNTDVMVHTRTLNAASIGSNFVGFWDGENWYEGAFSDPVPVALGPKTILLGWDSL